MSEARGPTPLVLLVHNYADSREMYAQHLSLCGYRVAEADNGLEGLRQAVELQPAAILFDVFLPGINGWEAARRLRSDGRTRHIATIVLTSQPEQRPPAEAAAADVVLAKPCPPEVLSAELSRLISQEA